MLLMSKTIFIWCRFVRGASKGKLIIYNFNWWSNSRIVDILLYYLFILYLFLIFDGTMLLLLRLAYWRFASSTSSSKDLLLLLGLYNSRHWRGYNLTVCCHPVRAFGRMNDWFVVKASAASVLEVGCCHGCCASPLLLLVRVRSLALTSADVYFLVLNT